jgi:hypothetical protein
MSDDVLREEIDWAKVIPEIKTHIAKSDEEFEQEWLARTGQATLAETARGPARAGRGISTPQLVLEKLVKLRCKRDKILKLLYLYVGGDPKKVTATKRSFQRQRNHMLSTAAALDSVANRVEDDEQNLDFTGIAVHNGPADGMRSYAQLLKKIADSHFKDLASKRVTGRDHHLAALVTMIRTITGAPRWNDIAVLVDRVLIAYNPQFKRIRKGKRVVYESTTGEAIRTKFNSLSPYLKRLFGSTRLAPSHKQSKRRLA